MNARPILVINYAKRSMKMTHRWLIVASTTYFTLKYGYEQTFFPIVQEVLIKIYAHNQQNILPIPTNKEMP
jgi:hypothetical protein